MELIIGIIALVLYLIVFFKILSIEKHLNTLYSINSTLNEYYKRDFAEKIKAKEDKIKAKRYSEKLQKIRIDEKLPEDYSCMHCFKEVGLDSEEQVSKIFICPYCEKENDCN